MPGAAGREGSEASLQLVVVSGDGLETFDLPKRGTVTIGRAANSDVRINHPSVSRQHVRLNLGKKLTIEDLGGSNGTFLDGSFSSATREQTCPLRRLARESAEVHVGEQILIGAVNAVLRHATSLDFHRGGSPSSDAVGPDGVPSGAVVQSEVMRLLYVDALRVAKAPISVLILGETGVGKELLARAIHAHSPRGGRSFMAINCATLGDTVLEGELFGYERGAFTGAVQARPGLFEAADGGTVFLDEVGELPLPTQAKLLRLIEERRVTRLGARTSRSIDVRFVSATNRNLEEEAQTGRFRQDLFYRLNGMALTIPPLRDRPQEIRPLASTFVAALCRQLERPALGVSESALRALEHHQWPGNVRELKNVVERAVVLCRDCTIDVDALPKALLKGATRADSTHGSTVQAPSTSTSSSVELDPNGFQSQVQSLERARILKALDRSSGNQTRAAELLGISRRTLVSRLTELGLPRPRKSKPS